MFPRPTASLLGDSKKEWVAKKFNRGISKRDQGLLKPQYKQEPMKKNKLGHLSVLLYNNIENNCFQSP